MNKMEPIKCFLYYISTLQYYCIYTSGMYGFQINNINNPKYFKTYFFPFYVVRARRTTPISHKIRKKNQYITYYYLYVHSIYNIPNGWLIYIYYILSITLYTRQFPHSYMNRNKFKIVCTTIYI